LTVVACGDSIALEIAPTKTRWNLHARNAGSESHRSLVRFADRWRLRGTPWVRPSPIQKRDPRDEKQSTSSGLKNWNSQRNI